MHVHHLGITVSEFSSVTTWAQITLHLMHVIALSRPLIRGDFQNLHGKIADIVELLSNFFVRFVTKV